MKKLFTLSVLLMFSFLVKAQTEGVEPPAPEIYKVVEVMPEYPGGEQALYKFLSDNVNYPDSAQQNNIQGRINVKFIVDEKGEITNVTTTNKKVGYGLEEEAIRVVSIMPKWKPGKNDGKTVKCYFIIPINFSLDTDKEATPPPSTK